jgi:hypothetical protein
MINLEQYGYHPTQQLNPQQPQTKPGVANYISEAGGIAGGLLGSLLGGVGAVGGATLGAGLGQKIENKLTGKNDSALKEALYSGAGELAGIGIAKGLGAAAKGLSKVAKTEAENIALKGVRATASQQRAFTKKTGQSLTDYVIKNKLFEGGTQQVDDLIAPLQQQYDDLAIKSGKKIASSNIYKQFTDRIAELKSIPSGNSQKLASQLENELSLLTDKFGKSKIDIGEITNLRREIDKVIKPGAFQADPIAAGRDKAVRDILKNVIDKATGQTKQIGQDLRDLNAFRDIAELQQGLGKGSLPVGLTKLLSAGVGGTMGGGVGYTQGGSSGAIKGALLGIGLESAANNPKTIAFLAKQLTKIGSKEIAPISKTAMNIAGSLGQSASQLLQGTQSNVTSNIEQTPEQNTINQTTTDQSTMSPNDILGQSGQTSQEPQYNKDFFTKALFNDFEQTGGKNISQILAVAKFLGVDQEAKKKAPTAMQAQVGGYANRLQNANQIFDKLAPTVAGKLTGKITGPINRKLGSFKPEDVKMQEQAERNFINAVLRRESGAAIAPQEFESARQQYFPQAGDTPAVLEQKRQNRLLVQQNFMREAEGEQTTSEDTIGQLLSQFAQ